MVQPISLTVQNQMLLEHLKTHWFYKIFGFVFVVYNFFSFFKYLKFSRFLKFSKANFETEKKLRIKKIIIENEN